MQPVCLWQSGADCKKRMRFQTAYMQSAREKTDKALYAFIKRITGAAHPRFMTEKGAQDVISALRTMMVKAGFNPDGLAAG